MAMTETQVRQTETDRAYRRHENLKRAARRRWLYANDPIWRLTKLKANAEARRRAANHRLTAGLAGLPSV